jgi:integrase
MVSRLTSVAVKKLRPTKKRREIPDGANPGLYLIIQPSGRKSWALRFRQGGKAKKLTLGSCDESGEELEGEPEIGSHLTLPAARRLASEVHRQRALGRDPVVEKKARRQSQEITARDRARDTFGALARQFVEQEQRDRTKNRTWRKQARDTLGLVYSSDDDIHPTVRRGSLVDRWCDKPVAELTARDIREVIREAYRAGVPGRSTRVRGAAASREREMNKTLSKMLKWLSREGLVDGTALAGIHPTEPCADRDRVLSNDELSSLWVALGELRPAFADVIRIMILTGARRGEVQGMKWDELSPDLSTWTIPAARNKSKRPHTVPLTDQVRRILTSIPREGECVFTTTGGARPVSGFGKIKYKLDAALQFKEPWRFHDLRRTVATGLERLGFPLPVTEAVLGHVSGSKSGIVGIYQRHEYDDEKRVALDRWADYIEAVITGKKTGGKVVPMRGCI